MEKAKAIWAEYCRAHDVGDRRGQVAGIDPKSGRVWFGESGIDIWKQLDAEGLDTPLHLVRIGYEQYLRKGGRR